MRRRRFLAQGSLILAAGGINNCLPAASGKNRPGLSRVVIVRDSAYETLGRPPDQKVASEMIARAVTGLAGGKSVAESWRSILGDPAVIGLKPNCLAGRGVSSSPEFVDAVCSQIIDNFPSLERIIVWERSNADLRKAGFEVTTRGRVQCYGNDQAGFGSRLLIEGSVGSLFSQVVTRTCDTLINLPVFKDHGIVGISIGMKNYYGAVHNPNKYHLNRGDPYVADLNRVSCLREKNVLNLCEAFTAQYEGGPPFKPQWSWPAGCIMASTDPVALDRLGWDMIEEQRAANGFPTLAAAGREPTYILTAADENHRLGQADPELIERIVLN